MALGNVRWREYLAVGTSSGWYVTLPLDFVEECCWRKYFLQSHSCKSLMRIVLGRKISGLTRTVSLDEYPMSAAFVVERNQTWNIWHDLGQVGDTFVDQYEICSNVGSVVPLPCLSGFVIRFCGNDYLISWIFSVIIFIYPDLFDSVLLGEFLEGMSLWYIAAFSFWNRITSDEIVEWRMRFVRNLTIVVWILRPTDDSLSPGPCLGNVGMRGIGSGPDVHYGNR